MTGPGGIELVLRSDHDRLDLAAFCGRLARLDPGSLVRLTAVGDRLTGYARLPWQVLVSRTVHRVPAAGVDVTVVDVTVAVADMLAATGTPAPLRLGPGAVRDGEWRGTLPPTAGWRRIEVVPVPAIDGAVRAAVATYDGARGRPDADVVAATVLDHAALTASDGQVSVVLPMGALYAAQRMAFLGPDPSGSAVACAVSRSGPWARLAAPYGSVYHRQDPGPVLRPG
ncbi:MAG: hypothetical protein HYR62_09270 [Actinobacteria bacterium]|nr:hypothetical protein [Actinomycetota bacterium]MBI3688072.1 hypothetical protein [Actinomycetota bacterium]